MKSEAFRNKYRGSSLIMRSFIQTVMNVSVYYVATKALSYYQGHKDVPEMLRQIIHKEHHLTKKRD